MQYTSPSGNVAFAQALGACEHMKHDGCREHEAQDNMPVQQVEPGEVPSATSDPPDARRKRQRDQQQRQQGIDGAAIPAPWMDQPGPDALQFAPQEQQQPEAHYAMQHKDKPFLREATDQADHTGHEGEDCGERKAPVGKAWRHETPLFFSRVWPGGHTPSYLRYLAIYKFADMIQSFLEGTWVATADLGHLRLAATAAADDLSQFLCKLSGVVALLY